MCIRDSLDTDKLKKLSKVAKTHKGRKILTAREGQEVEDPKMAVFMKGHKTSQVGTEAMKSFAKFRESAYN